MRWSVSVVTLLAFMGSAFAGSPYYALSEAQKRRIVVPDIRKLTNCVAFQILSDTDGVTYYRQGGFDDYVGRQLQKCPQEMNALLELYESTYGDGEAERFIKGPYMSDLPRAVLSLIKPRLDLKVAEQVLDEQRVRDTEAAQQAEVQRKAEQERLATARLEADRAAVEDQARRDKQARIDTAMGAMGVIRDRFYVCVDQQLPGLVKSGESADVLGSAAMTICGRQLGEVQDAAIEVARARGDAIGDIQVSILREQVKSLVKERVVADAVQAKAGVGAFAPTASK